MRFGFIEWTAEETQFLRKNASTMTNKDLAEALGRSIKSVRNKCSHLKLVRGVKAPRTVRQGIPWTESDEAFLRENVQKMTHAEMAEHLGRTSIAVSSRCETLRLLKQPGYSRKERLAPSSSLRPRVADGLASSVFTWRPT